MDCIQRCTFDIDRKIIFPLEFLSYLSLWNNTVISRSTLFYRKLETLPNCSKWRDWQRQIAKKSKPEKGVAKRLVQYPLCFVLHARRDFLFPSVWSLSSSKLLEKSIEKYIFLRSCRQPKKKSSQIFDEPLNSLTPFGSMFIK